ncbi:MAG: putative nickel-responsive regulator [Planctomycetes bacterium]|nr:putative nickel-responsive regulator [Planctomycetota bacterium]HRJ78484.1 nickel-responsive transcriptional regulator NikR [Planctomycetota bacterium]
MSDLVRLSLSIERPLYEQLERLAAHGEFANRSEFVRGMIRDRLVHEAWQGDGEALATITLVYDHHQSQLTEKLVELQHSHHSAVLAATHVHLDEHLCAEMIMVRGAPGEIRHLADHMRQQKGVHHLALSMTHSRPLDPASARSGRRSRAVRHRKHRH